MEKISRSDRKVKHEKKVLTGQSVEDTWQVHTGHVACLYDDMWQVRIGHMVASGDDTCQANLAFLAYGWTNPEVTRVTTGRVTRGRVTSAADVADLRGMMTGSYRSDVAVLTGRTEGLRGE